MFANVDTKPITACTTTRGMGKGIHFIVEPGIVKIQCDTHFGTVKCV